MLLIVIDIAEQSYNGGGTFLLNIYIINNKGVSNILRAYIEDFVYESDSVDEMIEEVSKDYPNLGGFDIYEVKDAGTPQEDESFYASITF